MAYFMGLTPHGTPESPEMTLGHKIMMKIRNLNYPGIRVYVASGGHFGSLLGHDGL